MSALPNDVTAALASLQARWGAAAPRTIGALATAPLRDVDDREVPAPLPARGSVISTGFAALDAILGPGGLPRAASVALHGEASSGTTTLALRLVAEAQAAGLIAAWLDLSRSFDPVEAVARGVVPEWLVVVTPAGLDEGLSIAGALLSGRAVDLLVVDLPGGATGGAVGAVSTPTPAPGVSSAAAPARVAVPRPGSTGRDPAGRDPAGRDPAGRRPSVADRLGRLSAMARRAGALFVVIEPPGLSAGLAGAVAEATGLRLELARRSWIHLGRDVVGQRTAVTVARNRFGPPGRHAELRILYAEGGERDACLQREGLLREARRDATPADPGRAWRADPVLITNAPAPAATGIRSHAPPPPLLATPPPRSRPAALRLIPAGPGRGGRQALDGRDRPGRQPGGQGPGHPARDPAGVGTPARP